LTIDKDVTVFLKLDNLKIKLNGYIDNTVDVKLLGKAKISILSTVVSSLINSKFENGISINQLLANSPLGFLNLTDMELVAFPGYATVYFTP